MKHEIKLYGEIINLVWAEESFQYIDLEYVDSQLSKLNVSQGDEVIFKIHSLGGDTALAFSIYNKIRRFGKENKVQITTLIDGYCASAGVILLLAGDKRIGNRYAEPFVHNAWTIVMGDKNETEKVFEELEKTDSMIATLYEERTKITKEEALELMNNNTFISAQDCLDYGFYTELENEDVVQSTEKQIIFNSLKRSRNNSINNKMTQEENSFLTEIKNLLWNKKPSKNAMLYTDKNEEVVFAELNEGEKPKVGDMATINGKNVSGTVNMADGSVYEFSDGKVSNIKSSEAEIEKVTLNSISDKLNDIIAKNSSLEEKINAQNSTIEGFKKELEKVGEFEKTYNSLKTIVSGYGAEIQNEKPTDSGKPQGVRNRFENFNPKN